MFYTHVCECTERFSLFRPITLCIIESIMVKTKQSTQINEMGQAKRIAVSLNCVAPKSQKLQSLLPSTNEVAER